MKHILFVALMLLAGCATFPDSVRVADENQLVDYWQVTTAPDANKNKPARWGGVIAKVENLPDSTLIEMVHYPLRAYGRPLLSDESAGRFRVYVDGFLDPMVYETGRSVTVKGSVVGIEEGVVGEHAYQFPKLKADGLHLWKNVQTVEVPGLYWPYDPYWYSFGLRHHYGYPYWHRSRVRVYGGHGRRGTGVSLSGSPKGVSGRSKGAKDRNVKEP